MNSRSFALGILIVLGFAAVVLGLLWRSPAPSAGQPPAQGTSTTAP